MVGVLSPCGTCWVLLRVFASLLVFLIHQLPFALLYFFGYLIRSVISVSGANDWFIVHIFLISLLFMFFDSVSLFGDHRCTGSFRKVKVLFIYRYRFVYRIVGRWYVVDHLDRGMCFSWGTWFIRVFLNNGLSDEAIFANFGKYLVRWCI